MKGITTTRSLIEDNRAFLHKIHFITLIGGQLSCTGLVVEIGALIIIQVEIKLRQVKKI